MILGAWLIPPILLAAFGLLCGYFAIWHPATVGSRGLLLLAAVLMVLRALVDLWTDL